MWPKFSIKRHSFGKGTQSPLCKLGAYESALLPDWKTFSREDKPHSITPLSQLGMR